MPPTLLRRLIVTMCAMACLALGGTAAGCTPQSSAPTAAPAPSPTWHPASPTAPSDAPNADVTAAIAGFDAYVTALNQLNPADASSVTAFLETTAGEQRQTESEFIDAIIQRRWRIDGSTALLFVRLAPWEPSPTEVQLEACVDASAMHYVDDSGAEHGPPSEERIKLLDVKMRNDAGAWLVAETGPSDSEDPTCA